MAKNYSNKLIVLIKSL